jgi:hypothetical protein
MSLNRLYRATLHLSGIYQQRSSNGSNGSVLHMEVRFSMRPPFPRMAFGIRRSRDIRFVHSALALLGLHKYTQIGLFKKPRGFLKSRFMKDTGTRFLQEIRDSAFDFGPPRALFVLILTAVSPLHSIPNYFLTKSMQYEKVVRSYKTGVYVPTGDFCAKWCNTWVRQYNKNFNKDNDWWSDLLEHYDVAGVGLSEQVDMSTLDEGRAALPMSSSP